MIHSVRGLSFDVGNKEFQAIVRTTCTPGKNLSIMKHLEETPS